MKTLPTTVLIGTVLALAATVVLLILFGTYGLAHADNAATSTQFATASTTITVAVTTSTRILATTSPAADGHVRSYVEICNPSAKSVVLALNGDQAADARTNGGIWLLSGACFNITPLKLYTGAIQASSSDQSSVPLLVNDYEQ